MAPRGGGGDGSLFLENLFLLGTTLGTLLVVTWIIFRIIGGIFRRCNDSLMAEVRINATMHPNYHEDDKLYHSLLRILSGYMGDDFKNRSITLKAKHLQNGKEQYEFISPPGYGIHYINYHKSWVRIDRRQTPEIKCHHIPFESLSLSTYKWNCQVLFNLLAEAKEAQRDHDGDKTSFYTISGGDWEPLGPLKRKRLLDSVITAGRIKELVLKDVKEFLKNETWYLDHGIPFRRGYLLYGPPGTGKSSLIRAIAGEINYDICILSLSSKDLTDDQLNRLMSNIPEKCVIVLEDIDSAFRRREGADDNGSGTMIAYEGNGGSEVTFRGFLNALDGIASTEGRIIFLTTNCIDKLDPSLLRPGRIDFKVHLDYPTAKQIVKIFKRFYPKAKDDVADTFLHVLIGMDKQVSMAEIQGLFLIFKDDPGKAIQHAEEYLNHQHFGNKNNFTVTADEDEEYFDEQLNTNVSNGNVQKDGKLGNKKDK